MANITSKLTQHVKLQTRYNPISSTMTDITRLRGSSVWLVPPEDSALYKAIHHLINNIIPSIYPIAIPPQFTPHITLTANTIPSDLQSSDSQKWLDNLNLPNGKLRVAIEDVQVGSIFFQKLTMRCETSRPLCNLAAYCRGIGTGDETEANDWVQQRYRPHCSLM